MAIGKKSSKGEFLPPLKYNAVSGALSIVNRVQTITGEWEGVSTQIAPAEFRAIPALDILEVGWQAWINGKPDMAMVGAGDDAPTRWGDPPSDTHKLGIRLIWKMSPNLGGDVREMIGTSIGLWNGIDRLHDAYIEQADDHPGQLPIVGLTEVIEQRTRNGSFYEPVFQIVGWKDRPTDLPKTKPALSRASKPAVKKPHADFDDQIPFK
jgi:hypothetical protein